MPTFTVEFEEMWYCDMEVEAENEDHAWDIAEKIALGKVDRGSDFDWDPGGHIDVYDVTEDD